MLEEEGGGRGRARGRGPLKQLSKRVRQSANKAAGLTADGLAKKAKATPTAMKEKKRKKGDPALASKKRKKAPLGEKLEEWNKILKKAATGRMGRLIG